MNLFQAIILGIVEGLTEFLPISSTGHLIIVQKLIGLDKVDEFFTVFIQLGSICAAVYFFRSRLSEILRDTLNLRKKKLNFLHSSVNEKLGIWIIISIIPTLIIAFIFRKDVEAMQNSIQIVAWATVIFGVLFYYIERVSKKFKNSKKEITTITLKNLVYMGIFQAIAIIPGVSRSGITIAGGLIQNIKIKDSIEISFIMGIPVIFAATAYKLVSNLSGLTVSYLLITLVGTFVAFVVGLYSIKITLGILTNKGFYPFMIYRIGLGLVLLFLIYAGFFS